MRKIIVWHIFVMTCVGELVFRISSIDDVARSENIEESNKKTLFKMGAGGHCSSRWALAVTDGMDYSYFTSYYLANLISTQAVAFSAQLSLSKQQLKSDFPDSRKHGILDKISGEVEDYLSYVSEKFDQASQNLDREIDYDIKPETMCSRSTLISCFIDNSTAKKEKLRFFQRGDSLIMRLKRQETPTDSGKYLYLPAYMTPNKHFKPHYFGLPRKEDQVFPTFNDWMWIGAHDLVVLGNVGLFGNIHIAALAKAANALVQLFVESQPSPKQLTKTMKALAEKYQARLVKAEKEQEKREQNRVREQERLLEKQRKEQQALKAAKEKAALKEAKDEAARLQGDQPRNTGGFTLFQGLSQVLGCSEPDNQTTMTQLSQSQPAKQTNSNKPIKFYMGESSNFLETTKSEQLGAEEASLVPLGPSDFFDCTYDDYIWELNDRNEAPKLFAPCVESALQKDHVFSKADMDQFEANYDPKLFAEGLRVFAFTLANSKNYRSPYHLKSLKSGSRFDEFPKTGKKGSITVMVGLVEEAQTDQASERVKFDELLARIEERRQLLYKALTADIKSYIVQYSYDNYRPVERKDYGKLVELLYAEKLLI